MKHDLSDSNAAGQVTLVGAGPGDPELLTLKALKAIQAATVLMVDDLVNEAIVAYASPEARIVHVGKRGGCKSTPQSFIEKLMVTAALEGENVVRLKGGDPFIFGRGGEEVENLQAAGIRVSVINGITSGLAAVTSLNVPLTHREHAHGVVFVTGHAKPGDTAWRSDGLRDFFLYKDLGVEAATAGRVLAQLVKANMAPEKGTGWHRHDADFHIVIMTKGWAKFMYGDQETLVEAGDCVHQRPGIVHYLFDYSPDMEYLEIVGPADFKSIDMPAPCAVPVPTPWK